MSENFNLINRNLIDYLKKTNALKNLFTCFKKKLIKRCAAVILLFKKTLLCNIVFAKCLKQIKVLAKY